jgi:hypothetical protein
MNLPDDVLAKTIDAKPANVAAVVLLSENHNNAVKAKTSRRRFR